MERDLSLNQPEQETLNGEEFAEFLPRGKIAQGATLEVEISAIRLPPFSIRLCGVEEQDIDELSSSLRDLGVIEPLIVRLKQDGSYELVAGRRRLEAAKMAGLDKVPVRVMDLSDEDTMLVAWTENVHRHNLSDFEKAAFLKHIQHQFKSQHELARALRISDSMISRYLKMLELEGKMPLDVLNRLSERHARVILAQDSLIQEGLIEAFMENPGISADALEWLAVKLKAPRVDKPFYGCGICRGLSQLPIPQHLKIGFIISFLQLEMPVRILTIAKRLGVSSSVTLFSFLKKFEPPGYLRIIHKKKVNYVIVSEKGHEFFNVAVSILLDELGHKISLMQEG